MKVIKEGEIKQKAKRKTCRKCDTEMEYKSRDIFLDQRDGDYIICPVCGKFINV